MSRRFGAECTAEEVVEGIDLAGRTAIVTGASGGLGLATARALAGAGAAVTMTARDADRGEAMAREIRGATDNDAVEVAALELAEPDRVRDFAKRWLAEHAALHILVNNAGVMACPLARNSLGWEMQFATCHLGHFLLTALLAPALRAGAPARIVNVSSSGHLVSPVDLEDPNFERRDYNEWLAYGQAKTANVLHAVELDRRLAPAGVRAFAVHPGLIATDLWRHLDPAVLEGRKQQAEKSGEPARSASQGAATTVFAATAPELDGRGGCYLADCQVAEVGDPSQDPLCVRDYAVDPGIASRLWTLSESLLGEPFAP